jgi:hypothetical protein
MGIAPRRAAADAVYEYAAILAMVLSMMRPPASRYDLKACFKNALPIISNNKNLRHFVENPKEIISKH